MTSPLDEGMEEACNFDPDSLAAGLSAEDGPNPVDPFEVSEYLMGVLEFSSCGGCMDPYGCNFNPEATWEDGTCDYSSCSGCLDPLACNFNPMVQATDSCDYCSCHWTDPMVDDNALSTLTINSRGVAELRSNSTIALPALRYGEPIEGVMRRSGVRTGSCGFNAAALIMQDSSLVEMSNIDAEHLLRLQYKEEFEREDRLGVDLHVRAIEEETTKPEGNDFIQVVTEGTATMALRADGSVEVWGTDVLYFGDWAESAQGSNGLNILEWARSLDNIVQVEFADVLWGVLALDGDGQLHAYSPRFSYDGIPEGFGTGTAFMECGYLGRCVLVHEDGSHAYMFSEEDYTGANSEPLQVPSWATGSIDALFEIGTPVDLSLSFIGMWNAALYDNGNVAIVQGGSGEPDETYPITILTPEEAPGVVDVVHGIAHSAVLDASGELTRYDLDTLTGLMVPSYRLTSRINSQTWIFRDQFPGECCLGRPRIVKGAWIQMEMEFVMWSTTREKRTPCVCGGDCLGDFDHDGECDLLDRPYCTYVEACTYLEEATWTMGAACSKTPWMRISVDWAAVSFDLDENGTVATSDLLVLLTVFGEECASEEVDFDPCRRSPV